MDKARHFKFGTQRDHVKSTKDTLALTVGWRG